MRTFVEDIMEFIFWNRERLISGEDTIPGIEEMYNGQVDVEFEEDYEYAADIAREYFKVYWKANDMMLDGKDQIKFEKPVEMLDGRYILGISNLEENGVICYMISDTENGDWKEETGLEDVRDILQVVGEFLS